MEQVTLACMTDGCQRQGQATVDRWCQACGLPNGDGPGATRARDGGPSSPTPPVGPGGSAGSGGPSHGGNGSGAVAIGVVVVLAALVLVGTHSMLGIGGRDAAASASGTASYAPQELPPETLAPQETVDDGSSGVTDSTEDPATTDSSDTTDTTEETTTTGPPSELTGGASAEASATAPDSKDDAGNSVSYEAARLLDGDPETAWRAKGDGRGVSVTLTLAAPSHITEVGLIPGYDKLDPASGKNRFFQDHRIRQVRWLFDDGTTVDQSFTDQPTMQRQAVDASSTTVTIEIVATLPSEPGFDYTPISDVSITGTQ